MLCGRSPQWAITGMPAETSAEITSACSTPPSSFTAWQRVSLRMRPAFSIALCDAEVEAGERHVDDHQGVPHGPAHHLGVVDHLLQRHRQRGAVSLDDHRQAVADQNPLDAGGIDQAGHGVVVGGQHGDLCPAAFMAANWGTVIC